MDNNFKFFYPVKILKQMSFEGKEYEIPVYQEGHILYDEVILCGKSKGSFVNKARHENAKILKNRLNGKMCPVCEEKWKAHPDSPWSRWTNGHKVASSPLPKLNVYQDS